MQTTWSLRPPMSTSLPIGGFSAANKVEATTRIARNASFRMNHVRLWGADGSDSLHSARLALALYLIVTAALSTLWSRFVQRVSVGAAIALVALPLVFTGRAMFTNRVY